MTKTALFLCPHHAAKSILAAAYFDQVVTADNLDWVAASAGTEPDPQVSPAVAAQLRSEGIEVGHLIPRHVTRRDLETADIIVSMGCDLDGLLPEGKAVVKWSNVPPASQDLLGCVRSIQEHLKQLVDQIK